MKFTDLDLHPSILRALAQAEFAEATPVQERTLHEIVKNERDVTVQSQTGTGKTGAFLLPFFQLRLTAGRFSTAKALVLAPTRELAIQIAEEAQLLGAGLGLSFGCVYGGVGYVQQETMLRDGVDLLVGTPGRLLDFVDSKKINLKDFSFVVIDEADRLLDMGFYPDLKKLFKMLRPRTERLTMLLSATISSRVSQLTWEYMNQPVEIVIESQRLTVDAIDQSLFHVARDEKMSLLLGILKKQCPQTTIVFCNTKRSAEEVAKRLELNGIPAAFIMGDLPQSKRLRIIQNLKDKKVGVLVATDVAARGLHIDALDLVVNYDLPEDAENYVHRIGRTARAGASGKAVSIACERYVYNLEGIEKYINIKIPLGTLSDDLLVADVSRGMRIHLSVWDDQNNPRRGQAKTGTRLRPAGRSDKQPPIAKAPAYHRHGPGQPAKPVPKRPFGKPGGQAPTQPDLLANGVEHRLAYYRKKYGDHFKMSPELLERLKREEAAKSKVGKAAPPTPAALPVHGHKAQPPGPAAAPENTAINKKPKTNLTVWFRRLFGGKN